MKKIIYFGYKEENSPYQMPNERAYLQELDNLPPGKYQHTIEKYRRVATHRQFGYLYSVVYPLSMLALNNAGYEFVDVEEVDNFWKIMFANKKIVDRVTGEIVTLPQSKSEFMTVDEMIYTDAIRTYCSEYLNTNIPDPDRHYKRKQEDK